MDEIARARFKAGSTRSLSLTLSALAALTIELSAGDGTWRGRAAGVATVALFMAGLLAVRRLSERWRRPPSGQRGTDVSQRGLLVVLCALWALPFLVGAVQVACGIVPQPLEVQLLCGLRNAALGLATLGRGPRIEPVACAISMFLALFASALSNDRLAHVVVALFTMVGVLWLMAAYWESLRERLSGESRRHLPRRTLVIVPLVAAAAIAGIPVAAHYSTTALPGFVPSSGGAHSYDPSARGGVNDGDALVAATENAHSFGPVESDIFLDSEEPSLYDVFKEMYGDPPKSRKTDKAISLPPEFAREVEQRVAKSEQAGREFSTVRRQRPQPKRKLTDLRSDALLHVSGRVPLHLRLQTYDLFDGTTWHAEPAEAPRRPVRMKDVDGKPWVEIESMRAQDTFRGRESHALKIVRFETNRIPATLGTMGIHIDRVDRADMFAWAEPSVLRMDRDQLPGMIVIHQQSRVEDESKLRQLGRFVGESKPRHRQLPLGSKQQQIRTLATEWTEGIEPGWEQVEALVERMERHCVYDRAAVSLALSPQAVSHDEGATPHDHGITTDEADASPDDTVAEFLFVTGRGTDYHFASAAAVMLRSLGYSTRLVSGFYADPEKFDQRSGLTPVAPGDVHFWAEVYVGAGTWATLEATPGYKVLRPPLTIWEHAFAMAVDGWRALRNHSAVVLTTLAMLLFGWRRRVALSDLVLTALWRLRSRFAPERSVAEALRLLESRTAWSGRSRRPSITPTRHLQATLHPCDIAEAADMRQFLSLANAALYDPRRKTSMSPAGETVCLCRRIVQLWSRSRIQSVVRQRAQDAPHRTEPRKTEAPA